MNETKAAAIAILAELFRDGKITREQFDRAVDQLNAII